MYKRLIIHSHLHHSLLSRGISCASNLLLLSQNTLLLQQLSKLSILMHARQDIASSNELLLNIQLWDRWPVGVLLDACVALLVYALNLLCL